MDFLYGSSRQEIAGRMGRRLNQIYLAQRVFSRSRISVSSLTSSGGGAAAGFSSTFLRSTESRSLLTPFTIKKMIQARMRKLMRTVRKLP